MFPSWAVSTGPPSHTVENRSWIKTVASKAGRIAALWASCRAHLDEVLQQVVGGHPAKHPFILSREDPSAAEVEGVLRERLRHCLKHPGCGLWAGQAVERGKGTLMELIPRWPVRPVLLRAGPGRSPALLESCAGPWAEAGRGYSLE